MTSSDRRTRVAQRGRRALRRGRWLGRSLVSLRRPAPVSDAFGYDRGTPIDRVYLEAFLASQRDRIRGRVLEVADDGYTRGFGAAVTSSDVLHAVAGNRGATIVGDLGDPATLGDRRFDCILLTQTLQFVPDPWAAVAACRSALADGGAVLATVPAISQVSRYDADRWGDLWRFTGTGAARLFATAFDPSCVEIREYGNAATACAFLQGLAAEELDRRVLRARHPDFPVLTCVVAVP